MTIRIKPNKEPFYFRPRKSSQYEKIQVDKMVNELLKIKLYKNIVLHVVH